GAITEGSVSVEAGTSRLVDVVEEGSCTLTERGAAAPGADLQTSFMVDAVDAEPVTGQTVTFELSPGRVRTVDVTNTYTPGAQAQAEPGAADSPTVAPTAGTTAAAQAPTGSFLA
ncbi:DUF5979 domain-containing protein, partial [Actinomyces bowdenii]